MTTSTQPALASGTFAIGGELVVHRLGFGAMRLTGPGIWGDPRDPEEAVRTVRRAVELGVNFIDTADSYGPAVSEPLIKRALHPYADDIVIATKAGLTRQGPDRWLAVGRPEYLRQQAELSLRNLGVERLDLYQLHRIDPKVAFEDQLGELVALQHEGKVGHIGLSEVSVDELERARAITPIASVQNLYNLVDRKSEAVLEHVEAAGIAFIPWFPLAVGQLADAGGPLDELADRHGASPSQLALAWLLHRSPVMLPIPGTSSVAHVEENTAAATIELSDEDFAELDAVRA
jgi:aryl-alcohol dehydrogenase-like predicted oxidoreductase